MLETILTVLEGLSIPALLVIVGAILLTLSLVGKIGGYIEVPPQKQNIAGITGAILLALGIILFILLPEKPPGKKSSNNQLGTASEPATNQQQNVVKRQEPYVTYQVVNVKSWDALNIRSGASQEAEELGAIPFNGRGIELLSDSAIAGWVKIRYRGITGWVNAYYLTAE